MPANPYEEPKIEMRSLEKAINERIDQMVKEGVDTEHLCKTKELELQALDALAAGVTPTTDVQRQMIIKRTFIRCIKQRFLYQ